MNSLLVIAAGSVPLVWLSRRSLRRPTSHGFFRFFAFEAILVLVVLNAPRWFLRPLAPLQLASWLCLIASLVLVVWGGVLLRLLGNPTAPPPDSAEFAFEHTSRLVTTGVYRYIRHPLYASLLFLAWGALLKGVAAATLLAAAGATIALVATAKAEEAEDLERFGEAYREYAARTRRFIPFIL